MSPHDAVAPAPAGFGVEVMRCQTSEPHALQGTQGLAEGLHFALAGALAALDEAQFAREVFELPSAAQATFANDVHHLKDIIDARHAVSTFPGWR